MIELQKVMTERQTATQLIVNLVDVLNQPTDDLPSDDTACSPADLGQ